MVGPAIATLLMVLCLGCQLQFPTSCQNCGSGAAAAGDRGLPSFVVMDPIAIGTRSSEPFQRLGDNLILEVMPQGDTTSLCCWNLSVKDAALGGPLSGVLDPFGSLSNQAGYRRIQIDGVRDWVTVTLTVQPGTTAQYGVVGSWTNVPKSPSLTVGASDPQQATVSNNAITLTHTNAKAGLFSLCTSVTVSWYGGAPVNGSRMYIRDVPNNVRVWQMFVASTLTADTLHFPFPKAVAGQNPNDNLECYVDNLNAAATQSLAAQFSEGLVY